MAPHKYPPLRRLILKMHQDEKFHHNSKQSKFAYVNGDLELRQWTSRTNIFHTKSKGWPFRLWQISRWHQNKSSVLVWGPCTQTQPLFWCKQEVWINLNGHTLHCLRIYIGIFIFSSNLVTLGVLSNLLRGLQGPRLRHRGSGIGGGRGLRSSEQQRNPRGDRNHHQERRRKKFAISWPRLGWVSNSKYRVQ